MPIRIEISSNVQDTRADVLKRRLLSDGFKIQDVNLIDVYTLDKDFRKRDVEKIASMLANPVTQQASINKPLSPKTFIWAIEVGFLPGVTDNVAATTREMVEDSLRIKFKNGEGVYTSQVVFISGKISSEEAKKIADSLYNPIIQRVHLKSFSEFKKNGGMGKIVPKVTLIPVKNADEVDLNVSDEELATIGKKGIANNDGTRRGPLALDILYLKTIREYFKKRGRKPTDVELESLAQTWSEHCKHTIFADPIDEIKDGLFRTYIKGSTDLIRKRKGSKDFCVSVFKDNSGAIEFDKDYLITHKVETHNSPSALDPFGGSITGIVGVNRDTIGFGLGAKPIVNIYGFCFADPKDTKPLYKGPNFTQGMLPPRRIMEGVIAGVNSGGNYSGIPTPQGFLFFDERYKGKPLVFVGTVGLIPKKANGKKADIKKAKQGDYVVIIGGRVGLDGIHGATFSSEAMDTGSPATAVQIGDPITQKKLSDTLVKEARELGLYNSITDNGAGGLSCSVAEMAKECGGCFVQLDKVPLKYPGLAAWQIWISESQERMTLAVPKNNWKKFADLMKRRGVEATVIGRFNASGKCIVTHHNKKVMDVEMKFLHDGLPVRPLKTSPGTANYPEPKLSKTNNLSQPLLRMLGRLNIASFEFISMQYDHEVQGTSVAKPLQGKGRVNAEATVIRPVLSSKRGVVLSQGICPSYSDIDTYHMAACCIDTAIRNAVSAGANPDYLALLDNFCWCSSTEPERLWQLKLAAKACYDYATAYGTPFISGKDSMFNDFKGYDERGNPIKISISPTLLISSIGVMTDVTKAVSLDAKLPGDLVYLLGETHDELGASEYFSPLNGELGVHAWGNRVPRVKAKRNRRLYHALYQCIMKGLVASAQSVGRGGLAVALAKTAIGGMLGLDISLKNLPGSATRDDVALFSESQGRIVATVAPLDKQRFERLMKSHTLTLLGTVTEPSRIRINGMEDKTVVEVSLGEALKAYKGTFSGY